MRESDCEYSRMKHKLFEKKLRGENFVIWSLNSKQVQYIQNNLGFEAVPYIFRISTKRIFFQDIKNKSGILKEIHFASRDKKSRIFRKLNHSDKRLLQEYGVYYTPVKYKILLNK